LNTKPFISIVLASALWLGGAAVVHGQSSWPTAKKTAVEGGRRKTVSTKKRRRAAVPVKRAHAIDEATLRSMYDLIARQSLALEALTKRLEAAERRLDAAASAAEPLADDRADLFRAALAVDWSRVIDDLRP
jgi:hypothetical protein